MSLMDSSVELASGYSQSSIWKKPRFCGLRTVGPYVLGPKLDVANVNKNIVLCLAHRADTDTFYTMKVVALENSPLSEKEREARMLLHNEYEMLSLLQHVDGVIRHHGLFEDEVLITMPDDVMHDPILRDEDRQPVHGELPAHAASNLYNSNSNSRPASDRVAKRLGLVLDCLTPHDFCASSKDYCNMQAHVMKERRLAEREAIIIFLKIAQVVSELHKRNIVHRDLRLNNVVLNKAARSIILTNFSLAKLLVRETELQKDQRCGFAYVSPEVLCARPYLGKPCDMWALGVIFYTMLYGKFPFFDSGPPEMTRKIMTANFEIPQDGVVSHGSLTLIKRLLVVEPAERLTACQVVAAAERVVIGWRSLVPAAALQVVPCRPKQNTVEHDDRLMSAARPCPAASVGVVQPVGAAAASTSSCRLSEFEMRLRELNSRAEHNIVARTSQQSMGPTSAARRGGPPIITRAGHDALPLAPEDIIAHQRILALAANFRADNV